MLWHVGSGLPWDWTDGPGDAGDRSHFLELLQGLPERSLLLADAGFVGYDFWTAWQQAGHDFVIRVGAAQLAVWKSNFGQLAPPATTVPEPYPAVLLFAGSLMAFRPVQAQLRRR